MRERKVKEDHVEITLEPSGQSVTVARGSTLAAAAQAAGVEIEMPCGGKGRCYRCAVEAEGELGPLSAAEKEARRRHLLGSGQRLACQCKVTGDATMRIPERSATGQAQIMEEGSEGTSCTLDPTVKRMGLELSPPTFDDQAADRERLGSALDRSGIKASFDVPVLRDLGRKMRDNGFRLTVTTIGDEVVEVGGSEPDRVLGMAFDIGTTTVVGYLMDLSTGRELAVASALNPQSRYGFDVISRIVYGMEHQEGLDTLGRVIRALMNRLIEETCARADVSPSRVYEVSVVGNTTMTHLFLGIDPRNLALAPYIPVTTGSVTTKARELGLTIHPEGKVYVLPGIGSFVGADTTGVIVSTQFHKGTGAALAIDIGTNGEIVGRDPAGRFFALSTAAGPAFEGAQISSGVRGMSGAIERVTLSGSGLSVRTIGNAEPIGICGSGLIDVISVMRKAGLLTESGRIVETHDGSRGPLARRVVQGPGGLEFLLTKRGEKRISVTQKDIRELQLAKGAVTAGVRIMLDRMGVNETDLREVLLAGAFGNYIDKARARDIGLLPKVPLDAIRSVGNAAGQGAKLALISKGIRTSAEEMVTQVLLINLAHLKEFQKAFLESMSFR